MFGNFFLSLSMLIILYTIGYQRFFFTSHLWILALLISICMISSLWLPELYIFIIYVIYYLLILIFSYIKLRSLFLASFYILTQNILLTFEGIAGYDFPLLILNLFNNNFQFSKQLLLYSFELLILLFFLWLLSFINNKYFIWDKIRQFDRQNPIYGILIIIFSNFILLYKQYLLRTGEHSSYFFLSITYILVTIFFTSSLFFISHIYLDKLFIAQLNKKYDDNLKFINLANEFQHDYKTFIMTTKRYLELEDFIGLEDYLTSLQDYSTPLLEHSLLNQINRINIPSIQAILFQCVEQCHSKKIKLSLNISVYNFSKDSFLNSINFARCFSILINNALEHSTGKIYISFITSNGSLQCSVKNTTNESINLKNIFQKNYSTKKGHPGLGLHILSKLIKHQPEATLEVKNTSPWISFTISHPN